MRRMRVGGVVDVMNDLSIETAGTEEEASKNLQVALNIGIEVVSRNKVEGKEGVVVL